MLIEIIIALLLGVAFGTITGLIPGIHTNLIGIIIVYLSLTYFHSVDVIYLSVLVVSMAITHSFIDFIPSVFLGCPDTDTELSVLPGHEMLKKGEGYSAILLTCYGSLAAIFILILIAFPSIFIISKTYDSIRTIIPFLLIIVSLTLISLEKKKYRALKVFLLTGFLGIILLRWNFQEISQPLLPLLTGLFGASNLILSIKNKPIIQEQKIEKPKIELTRPLLGATIAAPICSFLPGLGSGQAAVIGNTITNFKRQENDKKSFLVLYGATNTLVMGFSFISLYIISKTRTGAAVAIQELTGNLETNLLILILIITFIVGIVSFFWTKFLARIIAKRLTKINYTKVSIITLSILAIVVLLVSKPWGLLVLAISAATGVYCIQTGVKRTNMMGCLLIPTILFYLI